MRDGQPSTVDLRAPDGGRVVLQPIVRLDRLPAISRDALAAVFLLCAVFLATSVNRLNHTDLWGHLNFGRWMVEHRALPQGDPFRSAEAGAPFLNVPWLSQVLGYGCHAWLGLEGLVAGHAALVTLTAALAMLAARDRGVPLGWAAASAAAGYLLALPVLGTIRPQLFGMAAFAATLWAMSRLSAHRDPLYWLAPLYAAWANLHGSFVMGLAALGCLAAGSAWEVVRFSTRGHGIRRLAAAWADPASRRAWLALGVATAACCVNPLGLKLFPAVAGFSSQGTLEGISEWRPVTIDSLTGALMLATLVATAWLLRWSPRRVWTAEVLLFLVFGLGSLSAIRMLAWWALLWPWLAAPHAAAAWVLYRRTGLPEADAPRPPAVWRTLLAGACVLTALWWAPPVNAILTGRTRPETAVLSRDTPEGLARELAARGTAGRIYAPIDWADYLIWKTRGAVEPLVYSHVHLSGPGTWRDFLALDSGSAEWLAVADRHALEYLVVSTARNPRLSAAASRHPRCRIVYKDPQGLVVRIAPRP